jgi:hypothetical protein
MRYTMSIFRIIDTFTMKPNYDTSTITDESQADESLIDEISEWIQH